MTFGKRKPLRWDAAIIVGSFLCAFILMIWPLSYSLSWYRPEWVLLLILYWCIESPEQMGIGISGCIGIIVDILSGSILGQHAFAFALVAVITLQLQHRIRLFPLQQQVLYVLTLILCEHTVIICSNWILGETQFQWRYGISILTSILMWPLLQRVIGYIRIRLRKAF